LQRRVVAERAGADMHNRCFYPCFHRQSNSIHIPIVIASRCRRGTYLTPTAIIRCHGSWPPVGIVAGYSRL
jgi:hypothetical protein